MIAIGTNVLVRMIVDDPGQPEQVAAARALASGAGAVFVPIIVLVETAWVLETAYKLPKSDIVLILEHLIHNAALNLESGTLCVTALHSFRTSKADFADCLILANCRQRQVVLHTFDKQLAKLQGTQRVVV